MGTKRNESLVTCYGTQTMRQFRDNDQKTDTDSDNEPLCNTNTNWPRSLVVESSSDDLPLSRLSPFAIQKGFQAIAGTLKSIKRLRDGYFLAQCASDGLLKTARFVDRPVRVSVYKTLNSSSGDICCRELSGMLEAEIKKELQEQGVVEVHRLCF